MNEKKRSTLVALFGEFLSIISDSWLILFHDLAVTFKPKIRRFSASGAVHGKIHFCYCTCGKDFQYLMMSLNSLKLLHLDCIGTIYIYVDRKDIFSAGQTNELRKNSPFSIRIKSSSKPFSWGGVRLLLAELAAFEEISRDISPHDYILKVDSDVLFISNGIFKKVLLENYDAIGQKKPDDSIEGGSYFLKGSLVQYIVKSPIYKSIRLASALAKLPINQVPEDKVITKLIEQNKAKLLLCEYRLHGSEFRKLTKWTDLNPYSIIHFSYYAGIRKELMVQMWRLLKKGRLTV